MSWTSLLLLFLKKIRFRKVFPNQRSVHYRFHFSVTRAQSLLTWNLEFFREWSSDVLPASRRGTCFTGGRGLLWVVAWPHLESTPEPVGRDGPTVSLQKVAQLSGLCVCAVDAGLPPRTEGCSLGLENMAIIQTTSCSNRTRGRPFMARCETPRVSIHTRERLCLGWRGCDQLAGFGGCTQLWSHSYA